MTNRIRQQLGYIIGVVVASLFFEFACADALVVNQSKKAPTIAEIFEVREGAIGSVSWIHSNFDTRVLNLGQA